MHLPQVIEWPHMVNRANLSSDDDLLPIAEIKEGDCLCLLVHT